MKFNEKIVKLRKMKGLTQDEFASAVGVSRQAVYKWESGQSYPEVPKLLEMKLLFGVSIDDLLDENYEVQLPEKTKKKRRAKTKSSDETVKETVTPAAEEQPALVVGEAEQAVEAAPAAEEAAAEETKVETSFKEEKKVGFFGRLFGRK